MLVTHFHSVLFVIFNCLLLFQYFYLLTIINCSGIMNDLETYCFYITCWGYRADFYFYSAGSYFSVLSCVLYEIVIYHCNLMCVRARDCPTLTQIKLLTADLHTHTLSQHGRFNHIIGFVSTQTDHLRYSHLRTHSCSKFSFFNFAFKYLFDIVYIQLLFWNTETMLIWIDTIYYIYYVQNNNSQLTVTYKAPSAVP